MSRDLEELNDTLKFIKAYKWLEAAELNRKSLSSSQRDEDDFKARELYERIGFCYYRAAYQSETNKQFKDLIRSAQQSYEKASKVCEQYQDVTSQAKQLFFEAQILYLKSWLKEDPSDRKDLLDQCLDVGKRSLEEWNKLGDTSNYHKICNEFLIHLYARSELTRDYLEAMTIIEEALKYGETTIEIVGEDKENPELTRTRYLLSLIILDKPMEVYESVKKQQEVMKISFENALKAYESAELLRDPYLIGRSSGVLSYVNFELKGDFESSIHYANRQLEIANITKDNLLKAQANELLAYLTSWKTNTTDEDPEIQISEHRKALQYAENAIAHYNLISKPVVIAYLNHVGSYNHLAKNEVKLDKKIDIIKNGIDVAKKDLVEARKSGSLLGTLYILNELTYLLFSLIKYEKKENEKRKLIEESELIVDELIDISNRMQPFRHWNHSVFKSHSASLKIEHSKLENDQQKKKDLLMEALIEGEECIRLCKLHLKSNPSTALSLDFALGLKSMVELLNLVYSVTQETQYLDQAINTLRQVLQTYEENNLLSRVAETRWNIATIYNKLGQFLNSAMEFEAASSCYANTANKISHLNEFYLEYSNYMKSWSEIKKAKYYNLKKQYNKVKECYENAAKLHKLTKKWNYLYKNYMSWAKLAEAEDLSQKDKTKEAKELFQEILEMFEDSKKTIETHIKTIEIKDEQQMAISLIKASDLRREYCLGRMVLEEARILDRQGENTASSQKYGKATRIFQKIMDALETESERKEIMPIIYLCKAWKMMTLAEAEASTKYYDEAAKLFEKAKDHSFTQKTKLLAQGHSYFCRALYESSKFETTRDLGSYRTTNQYLTSAANYYMRAGYEPALEYSKATQRLFDAYVYMDEASSETDPIQKAKYYALAERVLEASADSYFKAQHPGKRDDVYRLLENLRREQKFVMSLVEILRTPLISSSTESFSVPTPTHEYAVGLESFEHANIQANLYMKSRDIKSIENLDITIELYNTGKAPAFLIKVEEIVPEKFEVVRVSGFFRITDQYLDMKGKMLGPLSAQEVSVKLKPLSKGEYVIKPRIVYIDDMGEQKTCEPEPVNVTVTDMGILSWIRGPRVPS